MKNLTTLNKELDQAKLNIKIFKACETIVDAFIVRNDFTFESLSNREVKLFRDESLFGCGSLAFSSKYVKHFDEMQIICFDKLIIDTKKIKSSIKLIEKELKKENSICLMTLRELAKEKLTA